MSAKRKTSEELQAEADKLAAKLKEARAEARKARRAEKLRAEKEREAAERAEAYELIQIAKRRTITTSDGFGGKQSVTLYDCLKKIRDEEKRQPGV